MTITYHDKKPEKKIKRVIVLTSNGKQTAVNPEWKLAKAECPNCHGRKCAMCSFNGVYRE